MSYYSKSCSSCAAPIYVTFKKLNGRESVATKIHRGAVQFEFHLKKATHSAEHTLVRRTYCVHCAPNGMVECWEEIRKHLLDPNGIDPPRKKAQTRQLRFAASPRPDFAENGR